MCTTGCAERVYLAQQVAEEACERLLGVHLRHGDAARPVGRARHLAARLVVADVADLPGGRQRGEDALQPGGKRASASHRERGGERERERGGRRGRASERVRLSK